MKIFLILGLLVFLTYVSSLGNGLVSDDIDMASQVKTWGASYIFSRPTFLRDIFYVAIAHTIGVVPWAFRLMNILFHLGNVILAYLLVKKLVNPSVAFLSASLFAVHPILVESVAWIAGGVYAQYGFFFLMALYFYTLHKSSWYIVSLLSWFLALVSSERAIPLVLLFPVYEYCFSRRSWKRIILPFALALLFAAHLVVSGTVATRLFQTALYDPAGGVLQNPLIQVPVSLSTYMQLILWPGRLTLFHDIPSVSLSSYIVRVLVVILFFVLAIFTSFRAKKVFFFLSLFFIPLIPFLTPFRLSWLVAERYAYLSTLGFAILLIFLIHSLKINRAAQIAITTILVIVLSLRTIIRIGDWKNEETLWKATVASSPTSPQAHLQMGIILTNQKKYPEAIVSFAKAISLNPKFSDSYYYYGILAEDMGNIPLAIQNYQSALKFNPDHTRSKTRLTELFFRNSQTAPRSPIH